MEKIDTTKIEQAVKAQKEKNISNVIKQNIDVLLADEYGAIDGYNAFLDQLKKSVDSKLFLAVKPEIIEIISDEKAHINKLKTIKKSI
jgi:hypothetical protein